MTAPLSPSALALASLSFWTREADTLAEARQNFLAVGKPAWAMALEPAHGLAVRRQQQARAEWFRITDSSIWLHPHPGFWDSRPDLG